MRRVEYVSSRRPWLGSRMYMFGDVEDLAIEGMEQKYFEMAK
jgi:hypothetical protein